MTERLDTSKDLAVDSVLSEALGVLDPATDDPNYWLRFRGWVVSGAGAELSRRRRMVEITVADVLSSWARPLLPTAALAAALAGIVLVRSGETPVDQLVAVEELLVSEMSVERARILLSPEDAPGFVMFASTEEF